MAGIWQTESSRFEFGGRSVGYAVRPGRGRRMKISVSENGTVAVDVPFRTPMDETRLFVARHAEWVVRSIDRQVRRARVVPCRYAAGETVYYLGEPCRLDVSRAVWKSVVHRPGLLSVALYHDTDPERVKLLVEDWFRAQAKEVLAAVLTDMMTRFGPVIRQPRCPLTWRGVDGAEGVRLTVRDMKTRWGSCSRDGRITLGAELIHVPRRLIEYVAVHELCHLTRLDHSKAFYTQLAMCLPDWKERRHLLETHAWLQTRRPA